MQKFNAYWRRALALAGQKDIFFNASAITFNLFICSIPSILIFISIIGYVLSFDTAFDEIVRYGTDLIPVFGSKVLQTETGEGTEAIERLLTPLVGARTVFGITGIIILLFFTQGLLHSFKHVIFDIFEVEERKHPIMDAVYNFLGFGILGSVFLFFSILISFISLFDFSVIKVPYTQIEVRLPWIYDVLDIILPIILTFILVYVIYRYVSERKVSARTSLVGAVIYTILFESAKFFVSIYLSYAFSRYQYFYQGYAVFMVLSIWAFYSSILFVVSVILTRAWKEIFITEESSIDQNPYAELD